MYTVTAFYTFTDLSDRNLDALRIMLLKFGEKLELKGLMLIADEGVNATVAAMDKESIELLKEFLIQQFGTMQFKDSTCEEKPFKRWLVKIRSEIVALGDPSIYPSDMDDDSHLTPQQWDRVLEDEDVVLLDTRNDYETRIGVFEGAVDPNLKSFHEFSDYVKQSGIPKKKKVLMYCTGGIRCEKASLEMKRQGYEHVYQLKGGILQYLQEKPNARFKGECFVFDHRCSVNQSLEPSSQFSLCPLCGDPGDQEISCAYCDTNAVICGDCMEKPHRIACSKNCAHHLRRTATNT